MTQTVKVHFSNGNIITTEINGTKETVADYYKIGRSFNLGKSDDDVQQVAKLEFIES